jgi:transcriptional regulator with XRE-family HTH domain
MLIDLKTTGQQIRHSRQQRGLSQAELARLADVSRATIIGIENGTVKEIGVNRLNRIVAASQAPQAPSRTRAAAQSATRKSQTLALSFPYDWSNPAMSDSALIARVVERGLFEDIAKVAARYGVEPLQRAAAAFTARNPAAAPALNRMLTNIEKALHASPLPQAGEGPGERAIA